MSYSKAKQKGAAMFVSMTMLLLVTIIILTSTRMSNLELMMGVNTQNAAASLMRAESSVVEGEDRVIVNFNGAPTFDFSAIRDDGLYLDEEIDLDTIDWDAFDYEVFVQQPNGDVIVGQPGLSGDQVREYFLEYIGPRTLTGGSLAMGAGSAMGKRYLYRVSGRGTANRRAARVVQTIFATVE